MAPADESPARDPLTQIEVLRQERSCANRPRPAAGARRRPQGAVGRGCRASCCATSSRSSSGCAGSRAWRNWSMRRRRGRRARSCSPTSAMRRCVTCRSRSRSTSCSRSPRTWPSAVAAMHGRGVIHRDISPANVVVSSGAPRAWSTSRWRPLCAELRLEFVAQSRIVGTLAYLAPEQTGRTGRPVDQRADLYALGATLYELATGGPPFGVGDPLRLVHDQLARVPTPPAALNPSLPAAFSQIICACWRRSPTAGTRPRTASSMTSSGCGTPRPARRRIRLGERDFPLRLLPPSRLVGRETRGGGAAGGVSRTRSPAAVAACSWAARQASARRRWSTSCGRW